MNDTAPEGNILEDILQSLTIGIFHIDREGCISFANSTALTILGTAPQTEVETSRSLFSRLLRDDGSPCPTDEHPWAISLSTGKALTARILKLTGPDGSITWLSFTTHPVVQPGEELPRAVIVTFADITKEKRPSTTRATLSDIPEPLSAKATIGLWEWELACRTINWSEGMYSIHDLNPEDDRSTEEEKIALSLQCYDPDAREQIRSLYERCIATGEPYDFESSFTTLKGRKLRVRTTVHAMIVDGTITKVLGCLIDLSEQKQAEENLRDENQRRLTLMNASRDGIVIINQQHQVVEANSRFADMLGYPIEEVLGMYTWEYEATLNEEQIRAQFADLSSKNTVLETRHRRKDGTVFEVEVGISGAKVGGDATVLAICRDITDRKQAEAERNESNEQMLALFNATFDSVILLDTDCRILAINHRGAGRRNRRPEQLVGHSLCELLPLQLAEARKEKIKEIILSGQPLSFEEERDGRCYFINMVGVLNKDGDIIQVASYSRDITERKQSEQLLRQVNRELHAINECRQALILAQNDRVLFQDICRIICNEAGYTMASVCIIDDDESRSLRALTWYGKEDGYLTQVLGIPREINENESPLQSALLHGRAEIVQDFINDKTVAHLRDAALASGYRSSIYLPLKDENGDVFGTLNIYSNHPNTFTTEETGLLESLANDLAYGIGFLRIRAEQDRNNQVNKARVDLIRFAQHNSIGNLLEKTLNVAESLTESCIGFYHFIHEDQGTISLQGWSTRTKTEFCRAEQTGLHYNVAAAGVWADCFNQRRPMIYNDYKTLPHRKGMPAGHAEVNRFLSVPVVRGDKIKAILAVGNKTSLYSQKDIDVVVLLADLAWEIVERKREEDRREQIESQLRQAQKMEAIGTLAGGIAHDFNNILGAIVGYGEMAFEDAREGRTVPGDIAQILKAAERARVLVKQILTFSRKVDLSFNSMNLNRQVEQAVLLLSKTVPKMICLHTELAPDLWSINADASQIEQILLNLAVNAADAMNGEGSITLRTANVVVKEQLCMTCGKVFSGPHATLEVIDAGYGMDEQTIKHIFEPFFTTKEVGKGTGLGLSTVYGIVMSHGGHVICSSELGAGTRFMIFFPVDRIGDIETSSEIPSDAKPIVEGNERILIVDDEEAILPLVTRQLRQAGYDILIANRGEMALTIYREQADDIDLVIMDLNMPGMGGYRALMELLAINPAVRIIIASGYAAKGQVQDALAMGAAAYVAKPFKQKELLAAVRRVLDGKTPLFL